MLPHSPAIFNGDILAVNMASIVQALTERRHTKSIGLPRRGAEKPNNRHNLPRMCGERPRVASRDKSIRLR
jgi:hypothetical protein